MDILSFNNYLMSIDYSLGFMGIQFKRHSLLYAMKRQMHKQIISTHFIKARVVVK